MYASSAQDQDALPTTSNSALMAERCAPGATNKAEFCIGDKSDGMNSDK